MKNYVIINGTNSNTLTGLMINELPPITKPEMRTQIEEIDGRDGDIITKLGYSAYNKTITIGLFGTGYDVDNIIKFFNKEGTIIFSNEPDKYYFFKQIDNFDIERLLRFKTASITFHCQPFKYPTIETQKIIQPTILTSDGESITINNTAIDNLGIDLKGNTSQSGTPTPTSPIPVSVVSGDNEVVVNGKNLVSFDTFTTTTNNGVDITNNNDGTLTLNGTANSNNVSLKISDSMGGLPTGSYTIYVEVDGTITNTPAFIVYGKNGGTPTALKNFLTNTTNYSSITTTTNYEGFYIWLYASSGVAFSNTKVKIMILKGTYSSIQEIQPYEPYTSQTYEVDLPVENLLNNALFTAGGGTTIDSYDNYSLTGTYHNAYTAITQYINVSNGKYTFSIGDITNSTARVEVYKYKNGSAVGSVNLVNANGTLTLDNTDNSADQIRITLSNNNLSGTNQITFNNIQLEKGSKANHYTPYGTTPIELCKIGTYQDYLYKDNGNWYIEKQIGKVVLDGSESSWGKSGASTASIFVASLTISSSGINLDNKYGTGMYWFVNRFTYNSVLGSAIGCFNLYNGSATTGYGNLGLSVDATTITDIATFKTWLSTHNTIVYYVLNTPTDEEITDTNLIEQLDDIEGAYSYETQTNISQTNNDKPFIISASAVQSGTNEITVNNSGTIYSKPTIALEGNGIGDVYLNNTQIFKVDLSETNKITISTSLMEAYNPDTNALANRKVIGNYNSFRLTPGNNTVKTTGGITKATITNYTRWL